jgi:hypothetical protein
MSERTVAQSLIMGGGNTVKFATLGDEFTGIVDRIGDERQANDIQSGKPKFWDEGQTQPVMLVPIEMRSDADGKIYVLNVGQSSELQRAIATAVRESGADNFEEGAWLGVRWIGEEKSRIKGGADKKLYAAAYKAPASKAVQTLMAPPAPRVAQTGPVPPVAPPVAPAPVSQGVVNATPPPAMPMAPVPAAAAVSTNPALAFDPANLPPEIRALLAQYTQPAGS